MTLFKRQPKTPDPAPDLIPFPTTVDNHGLSEYVTCATCGCLTLHSRAKKMEVNYEGAYFIDTGRIVGEGRGSQQHDYYCPKDSPDFDIEVRSYGGLRCYYRRVEASWEEVKLDPTPKTQPTATPESPYPDYIAEYEKRWGWACIADDALIGDIWRALDEHGEVKFAALIRGRKLQPK